MSGVSAFSGLNLALRGLLAQQRALDVTGHNIANVETEGYSRQEAILTAAPALDIAAGALQNGAGAQLGQGVDVQTYRRLRDDFLDLQWRTQNMAAGQADVTAQRLGQVEGVLGESSDTGLGKLLTTFWSAWSELASHPESGSARTGVAGAAKNLAGAFNALDGSMAALQGQATQGVSDLLGASGPVTAIAGELAKLNVSINQAVAAGQEPNDLKDRRDLLLDKLSAYGQVSVTPDATYPAMLNVSFAGATTPLINQGTATVPTPADISATPGGQLGGLIGVANTIAGYRTTLDGLANTLAAQVNAAHGSAIFTGAGAGGLTVTLPLTVNAGSTTASGANDIARAIAALRGGAVDQGWAAFVTQVGGDVATAANASTTQGRVLDSLSAQRTAVSGVSLDEEMTNMVRFQRAYQASARVMSTMDETLDTLINRTGRVGL